MPKLSEFKSLKVKYQTWKKLKQESLDKDVSIWKIIEDLVDDYLS